MRVQPVLCLKAVEKGFRLFNIALGRLINEFIYSKNESVD